MESTLEEALAELEASADLETFFQTSFVLLKILQNIVSTPEDDKYRRIRRASKVRRARRVSPSAGRCCCHAVPKTRPRVFVASQSEWCRRRSSNCWVSRGGT